MVQFFADTNLVGVITDPPFNFVWYVDSHPYDQIPYGSWCLKAVAVDNQGATAESSPVQVGYGVGGRPSNPVVGIASPMDGSVFPAPGGFVFGAELLASANGDTGPVEFFLGTNSVGVVTQNGIFSGTTPLYLLSITNLPEGVYPLSVKFHGSNGPYCRCGAETVRVAKLGVQLPRIGPDAHFAFDVVTSFPGEAVVIEVSSNLANWAAVSTNMPPGNPFTFIDPSKATNSQQFYRVRVPSR